MAEITIDYTNVRNPQMKRFLENGFKDVLFSTVDGHDHDGTNSKALSPAAVVANDSITTAMLAAAATPNAKAIVAAHEAAIPVTGNGDLALTIDDAAETNSLAVPTFAGQEISISADTVAGTGSRTVTVASPVNATGNNTILFDAAGEFVLLRGIKLGATFAWRVVVADGATLSTVA